jgi:acyl-CoA thioesterase
MLFSETLQSLRPTDSGFRADIGEDWSQGRATFGGLVAAIGNEAMRRNVPMERQLRGLNVTFAAPVVPGVVDVETRELRVGKVVTIAQAELISAGAVAATMTGIYGSARVPSVVIRAEAAQAAPPTVENLSETVFRPDVGLPAFLQHFALRWAEGTRPFTATPLNRSKAYIRHRDSVSLSESHVIALIDVIPSPVLQMMSKPAPASSLIWTLEFLRHDYQFPADAWWRIDTQVPSSVDGYASQASVVLNPDGIPAAFSQQLVAVFG